MSDKKLYFIGGLGASGKTTLANKIASELNIPTHQVDDIHRLMAQKMGISFPDLAELVMPKNWVDKSFGAFPSVREAFKQSYLDYFNYLPPKKLVLEGESPYWNKEEMKILREVFPDYEMRFFLVQPRYERWLKNMSSRERAGTFSPLFREQQEYIDLSLEYLTYAPAGVWVIEDVERTECSLTGGINYQTEEFSSPKWEVFDFPKDMSGRTFLDISCNTGWFCKKAREAGASVTGIDISWQVLDIAQDRNPDGVFLLSKIEDFTEIGKTDYILSSSAFHYYHDRERVLEMISRATTQFVLETPVIYEDREFIRYQGGTDNEFCSIPTEKLLLKWLNKYFKSVKKIGETIQPGAQNRPVYLCEN